MKGIILFGFMLLTCSVQGKTNIHVKQLADGLERPWAVAQLPDQSLLITERNGQLRWFHRGKLSAPITGLPQVYNAGQGGMLDIKADPNFAHSRWVFFTYAKGTNDANATHLGRAKFVVDKQGKAKLTEVTELFAAAPKKARGYHFSGRIEFLPDDTLVFAVGDGYSHMKQAQTLDNHFGKVIRLNKDGSVPKDNPYLSSDEIRPEIYSYGHRNPQGMSYDAKRGLLFSNEHGPKGGDEINIIKAKQNYGWPVITYGIDYSGDIISELTHKEGMEQPLLQWTPSIAPSSLLVYYGKEFPEFNGHLLTTTLKYQELRLVQLTDSAGGVAVDEQQTYLKDQYGRLRDIEIGQQGELYLVTDAGLLLQLNHRK